MNPKPWLPLASLLFFALPLGAEPAAIEGERFPGETWLQYESPEEAGYSAEKLADAWARVLRDPGQTRVAEATARPQACGEWRHPFLCGRPWQQ